MTKTLLWMSAIALPLAMSAPLFAQSAMQGTMAPAGGKMSAASVNLSAADKKFVEKAAIGGMAEVQLAQLAQQKSQDAGVKDFAQHMIDDHTPNNDQLMKLATAKGITPPAELDSMHQKELDKLQGLDGKKFDHAYIAGQTKDHNAMLKTFQMEQTKGQDADLKAFADQTVPTIQKHITMVPKA